MLMRDIGIEPVHKNWLRLALAGHAVVVAVKPRSVSRLSNMERRYSGGSCRRAVRVVHRRPVAGHLVQEAAERSWGWSLAEGALPLSVSARAAAGAPQFVSIRAIASCSACVTHSP